MRIALDEAALRWCRIVETEVLGRYDLVDEEKYTGMVAVPTTRHKQLLVRRGQGLRREAKRRSGSEPCAACWRGHPLRRAAEYSAKTTQNLQFAMALLTRPTRDVDLEKSWLKNLVPWTDARLQVVQQLCMHKAGQIEVVTSRTWARAWKDWASTTAMADGARLAHRWMKQVVPWSGSSVHASGLAVQPQEQAELVANEWHELWRVGRECQIDFGGVKNAPVVPSPSLTTCVKSVSR